MQTLQRWYRTPPLIREVGNTPLRNAIGSSIASLCAMALVGSFFSLIVAMHMDITTDRIARGLSWRVGRAAWFLAALPIGGIAGQITGLVSISTRSGTWTILYMLFTSYLAYGLVAFFVVGSWSSSVFVWVFMAGVLSGFGALGVASTIAPLQGVSWLPLEQQTLTVSVNRIAALLGLSCGCTLFPVLHDGISLAGSSWMTLGLIAIATLVAGHYLLDSCYSQLLVHALKLPVDETDDIEDGREHAAAGQGAGYSRRPEDRATLWLQEIRTIAAQLAGQEVFPPIFSTREVLYVMRHWLSWALSIGWGASWGVSIAVAAWLPMYFMAAHQRSLLSAGALSGLFALMLTIGFVIGSALLGMFYSGLKSSGVFAASLLAASSASCSVFLSSSTTYSKAAGITVLVGILLGGAMSAVDRIRIAVGRLHASSSLACGTSMAACFLMTVTLFGFGIAAGNDPSDVHRGFAAPLAITAAGAVSILVGSCLASEDQIQVRPDGDLGDFGSSASAPKDTRTAVGMSVLPPGLAAASAAGAAASHPEAKSDEGPLEDDVALLPAQHV